VLTVCRRWFNLVVRTGLVVALLSFATAQAASTDAGSSFVRTIYLVRHGSYVADPRANPETGPGLTPLGIAQARLIGARLRGIPVHFDSITSSTLTRAVQTAAVVRELFPDVAAGSAGLLSECTPPTAVDLKGEPIANQIACKQRLDEAFARFFAPPTGADKNDVLVCHGNVIRYFVTKALGVDTRAWPGMSVAHASVTIIQVRTDGSFRVIAVGDAGHVPPNLQSWGTDADPQLVVH
jgi:serine/threonine-protein phosphatase PGAM5